MKMFKKKGQDGEVGCCVRKLMTKEVKYDEGGKKMKGGKMSRGCLNTQFSLLSTGVSPSHHQIKFVYFCNPVTRQQQND